MTDAFIPGSGGDPIMQQLLARAKKGDEMATTAQTDLKASQAREEAARAAQQQALAPARDKMKTALQQGSPSAPDFPKMPEAPKNISMDPKEFGETLSTITALAAISGALTRAPLTAALNAFSEGVKGYVQGKKEVFDENFKLFNQKIADARTENEATWRKYEAARNKHKDDIQALQNEMTIIAAETQNPIALELAQQGRVKDFYDLQMKANSQVEKVLGDVARYQESKRAHDQAHADRKEAKAGAASLMSPEAIDDAATQFRITGVIPSAFRDTNSRAMVQNRAAEQRREQGKTAEDELGGRADVKAAQSALTQVTKDLASIQPFKKMLDKNADIAVDLAQKVIATDARVANKSINWVRQNLTDNPDSAEFLAQMQIVSTEAARVLNNPRLVGQLTDSARHEMQEIVNGNMPLDSLVRVIHRIQQDGANRVNAMKEEQADLRGVIGGRRTTDPKPTAAPAPAGPIPDGWSVTEKH